MSRKLEDMRGQKFGKLEVIGLTVRENNRSRSLCRCECGTEKMILNVNLKNGSTSSCGCMSRKMASQRLKGNLHKFIHGDAGSITHSSWSNMMGRCTRPSNPEYHRYAGRGITVCQRWADPEKGYLNFVEDMGYRPSSAHSIDRIDGNKGYEPGNCRWATKTEQSCNIIGNRRNTSGYRGVTNDPRLLKRTWVANIVTGQKLIYLGAYTTKEEAALAYNVASEALHGVFGQRNNLPPMDREVVNQITKKVTEKVKKIINNEE